MSTQPLRFLLDLHFSLAESDEKPKLNYYNTNINIIILYELIYGQLETTESSYRITGEWNIIPNTKKRYTINYAKSALSHLFVTIWL